MKIQLLDVNAQMCDAWLRLFRHYDNVSVLNKPFFTVETECVVSPANSFGFMDGNLDYVISQHVGWDVQDKLQKVIKDRHHGELLVGQAELIETSHEHVKYVISAPTMRVPSYINNTVNVYLASKAIFRIIKNTDKFKTVTISGLGTGCGGMSEDRCAMQMWQAYFEIMLEGEDRDFKNWREAQTFQYKMQEY